MGYFTYRLFKDISLERLRKKAEANLALYEPKTVGRELTPTLFEGCGCSAMLLGYRLNEPGVFEPVGYQFGGIWMDVRYQDGDWWDLTIFHGTEHKCSHNVNPWAGELRHRYNQDHIDYRIKRVLELWPQQARRIEHYLLPWRTPVTRSGKQRFVPRR